MTMFQMSERTFSILLLLGLALGGSGCVSARKQAAAAEPVAADEAPVKRDKLFGAGDVQPEGNSALHYIDARLYELRDQDQSTLEALRLALQNDPDSSYLHGEMVRNLAQGNQFEQAALEADKALRDWIATRRLAHDGTHSDLRAHLDNANARMSADGRQLRIVKRSSAKKIDGAVALGMGCARAAEVLPLIIDGPLAY